jgi:hypothetical protein
LAAALVLATGGAVERLDVRRAPFLLSASGLA